MTPIGKNRRNWLVAKCPFAEFLHKFGRDTNPSFFVKINDSGYSGYNCFTCHQTGNMGKLIEKLGGLRGEDYSALVIRALIEETPDTFIDWDERQLMQNEPLVPLDQDIYFRMYPPILNFKEARRYLAKRQISEETAELLQLRYDPDEHRVLFPVFSGEANQLFGFTGRAVFDAPAKVKDYSGLKKDRLILGEQLIQEGKPILLVEGLFAYANMYEICADDFCSPIASMGSRLSDAQRDLIVEFQLPVYLLYDNDEAGQQGLYGPKRKNGSYEGGGAIDQLKDHVPTYIAEYPTGVQDPDNLTTDDVENIVLGSGHYMA